MLTPKKALVVDDSRSARYSLRKTLERLDISVDCVESGENALSYLEAAQASQEDLPDIIFMDNLMPGLSGLDTTETINQDTRWSHIPVVMCTATQNADQASQQTAAAGFLPKPATSNQIQTLLASLSPSAAVAGAQPSSAAAAAPETTSTDSAHTSEDAQQAQPSLIQGSPASAKANDGANDSASDSETTSEAATNSGATATAGSEAGKTSSETAGADGSLDALIDQLQGQLNGIEPRLLSLESAKHTLDSAIHQRLKEMHDQLVAHVHQLIQETMEKHGGGATVDSDQIKTQVSALLEEAFNEKLTPLEQQLREEIDSQSRHIEHRLMGEVVDTNHVIEQASAAATKSAQTTVKALLEESQWDQQHIDTYLAEKEKNILAEAKKAAQSVGMEEAEKIACQQAEKAVSDNLQRLQRQLADSAQSQINSAVKRQQIMALTGFGVAIIALVLSVVL